ncbi:MAG: hypothetical protein JSS14_22930 [Proteobacteria bacterium]|nr:hypothetical protein [Pseudomonadota bacterium]
MTTKQSAIAPKKSPTAKLARKTAAEKPAAGKATRVKRTVLQAAKAARLLQEAEAKQIANAQKAEEKAAKQKAERDKKVREREVARQAREAKRLREKEEKAKARKLAREQKAKPPRMPRPGLPIIKKDMELDEAMMRKDWSERPLTGRDLDTLCRRFRLNPSEFASALGLQNRFEFMKLLKTARVLPFDVEMLARLYEMSPSPAPWVSHSADQAFQSMYGDALAEFDSDEVENAYARTLFYARFTGALDRSSSTAYRWVEEEGKARLVISLFLRKLMSMDEPLQVLEDLARLVHANRGGDFEKRSPYPERGAHVSRRGRVAKVDRLLHKVRGATLPIDIKPIVL